MAGAEFVRADLHVHTIPDDSESPRHGVEEFIATARDRGLRILGITDHNTIENVATAIEASKGTGLLILPGVEISTNDGHLLALFSPEGLEQLRDLMAPSTLALAADPRDHSLRSSRSFVELVREIDRRGGLAIPAHVDIRDGVLDTMSTRNLSALLAEPGLAALEFAKSDNLTAYFTSSDASEQRRSAWQVREAVSALRDRGLARVMSSDAHSPDKVGRDRGSRTMTRLRLDECTFEAVRYALVECPRARCKAEATLPPTYPHIVRASYEGGFLDGVAIDFSPNLNCVIGGRGSGKSTALLALRAALGASADDVDETGRNDPDDPDRMPQRTVVRFVDDVGSERTAVRELGGTPYEEETGAPIALDIQGLRQDESGSLARGYQSDPRALLRFLDSYVDKSSYESEEVRLRALLDDNRAEVLTTYSSDTKRKQKDEEVRRLEAQLEAAKRSRLEELAKWAQWLASEGAFLSMLGESVEGVLPGKSRQLEIDLDALALDAGLDLARSDLDQFLVGPDGLRAALGGLVAAWDDVIRRDAEAIQRACEPIRQILNDWKEHHAALRVRFAERQKQLEAAGLKVEAGALVRLANQLESARKSAADLKERYARYLVARRERGELVASLHQNRDRLFERRRATLRQIVEEANNASRDVQIHLVFERQGIRDDWKNWLTRSFHLRSPRADRVAAAITPLELSKEMFSPGRLSTRRDSLGEQCFGESELAYLEEVMTWENLFDLETFLIEDRVRIQLHQSGSSSRQEFDHLSEGQQRSILLSLLLWGRGSCPLVMDQPEDHLDAPYIANALVRHLEAAKERRQVIVATHSANVTVLGDSELVVPLYAERGRGAPRDQGSVDREATRARILDLLEGGRDALLRRVQRYGVRIGR